MELSGTIKGPLSNFIMSDILGIVEFVVEFKVVVSFLILRSAFPLALSAAISSSVIGALSHFIISDILGILTEVEFVVATAVSFLISTSAFGNYV